MTSDVNLGAHSSVAEFNALPALRGNFSVSFVALAFHNRRLKVLCRPCEGLDTAQWVLPGGPLYVGLTVDESARQHLRCFFDQPVYHEQLKVFGVLNSQPLTIGYLALVSTELWSSHQAELDALALQWRDLDDRLELIPEQQAILQFALRGLRSRLTHEPLVFGLLPRKFTLLELQQVLETILHVRYNKGNFRRRLARMPFIFACREKQQGVAHRAAEFYSFDAVAFQEYCAKGFAFSL